jgi:hypothetical protein
VAHSRGREEEVSIDVKDLISALQQVDGSRGNPRIASGLSAGQWATAIDTRTDPYLHGPGGLFGVLGLEKDVISTRIVPRGLAGRLPVFTSDVQWPLYPYFMGVTDSEAVDDAQGTCDDPPGVGNATTCRQTTQWGRLLSGVDMDMRPIPLILLKLIVVLTAASLWISALSTILLVILCLRQ